MLRSIVQSSCDFLRKTFESQTTEYIEENYYLVYTRCEIDLQGKLAVQELLKPRGDDVSCRACIYLSEELEYYTESPGI